ncbi:MAG: hypothetical protein ABSA47_12735, partial [Verrucomicrobiota bacterium]
MATQDIPNPGLLSVPRAGIHSVMRRLCHFFLLVCLFTARTGFAADGKVIKALPELLNTNGVASLSPSLFERDAYQAWLRQ